MVGKGTYIGHNYASWERLCLVFEGLGYDPPSPDTPQGGAYLMNVMDQYRASLSEEQILRIADFALAHAVEALREMNSGGSISPEILFR